MRGWQRDLKELVTEQFEFRELLFQMASRDLLLRYKQTVMGFGWALLMPLLNTAIFSIVFMRVAPIATPVPYPLFAYCGLVAWNFTASALRFALTSLTANTNLVTKVYFPREIFPFSAVAVAFVDSAVAALVLLAMMAYYHIQPTWALLALPGIVLIHVIVTTMMALALSMANLFYRDVKYLFEVILTVWMFSSAVVYPSDALTGTAGLIISLNPMTVIVESYRSVLLYGALPAPLPLAAVAIGSVVGLPAVWLFFHRSEFQFAENI
ncbi:MAG TPA: ABC transporter permease [Vicinamibacterales bacterium]|jgi:ABC-type polysaccharide/polyol phosphate export permease|nr:ABC transporter permease [Vicinamibacterales bacterium]